MHDIEFVNKLMAAVWMVGNMDTEQDKAAWWRTFGSVWQEVADNHGELAQAVADQLGHAADGNRVR
jgi:hypothetical protein